MNKHQRTGLLLSIIPGFGQFYHRQYSKGILFFVLFLSFIVAFSDMINIGLWGIVTLGEKLPRDHSIFLLVQGLIAIIVIFFGIAFYVLNLTDASKDGKKRDQNIPLHTWKEQYRNVVDKGFPYLIISPGFILMIFVVVLPILFMLLLSFTSYDLYHSPPAKLVDWVGFQNYRDMFAVDIWRDTFVSVFAWTIIWTFASTTGQIVIGITLSIILNQKDFKFKRFFRTILNLSWAVPAFVSVLVLATMFNDSFGSINQDILPAFGIEPIPWMTDAMYTKIALVAIQWWLGFPFVMAMTTGVLQSIPEEMYEAAVVDGASAFQKFKHITLPMILFATAPLMIIQYTGNFNNFNIIYLFNGGGPAEAGLTAGGTDILISWIYSLTMVSSEFSKAAAITVILSIIIMTIAVIQFRQTKSYKDEGMM